MLILILPGNKKLNGFQNQEYKNHPYCCSSLVKTPAQQVTIDDTICHSIALK